MRCSLRLAFGLGSIPCATRNRLRPDVTACHMTSRLSRASSRPITRSYPVRPASSANGSAIVRCTTPMPRSSASTTPPSERREDTVIDAGRLPRAQQRARQRGFFEYEIHRETQIHGAIAHVWSTYEWRSSSDGPVGGRSINSIQLYHNGQRRWITSWMFDRRSDAPPVPADYLRRVP